MKAPKATGKPQHQPSTPKPTARPTVQPTAAPATQPSGTQPSGGQSQALLQRAAVDPLSLTRADLQRLSLRGGQQAVQRAVNNPAVRQARTLPVAMPTFRPMAQIQAKLTVGPVGDRYEQEADRMADRVMRMADSAGNAAANASGKTKTSEDALQRQADGAQKQPGAAKARPYKITPLVQRHPSHAEEEEVRAKPIGKALFPWIQRHPGHGEEEKVRAKALGKALIPWIQRHPGHGDEEKVQAKALGKTLSAWLQRHPSHAEEEEVRAKRVAAHVQRKGDGSFDAGAGFEQRMARQRGSGRPLPPKLRTKMESGFGADFSSVRVHTGSPSVQLNRDIGAQAFTHRNDIHFGAGKYNPHSSSGQHLLAHELTHVVQQNPTVQTKRKDARRKDASPVAKIQASPAQIQRKAGWGTRALKGLGTLVQLVGGVVGAGVGATLGAIGGTLGGAGYGAFAGAKGAWNAGKHSNMVGRVALTVLAGIGGLVGGAAGGAVAGTVGGMTMGAAKGFEWLDPRNFWRGKRHTDLSNKFGQIGPDGKKGSTDRSFSPDMMDRIEDELETIPTAHTKGNTELSGGIRDVPDNPNLPIRGASSFDKNTKTLNIVRPDIPGTKTSLPPALYNTLSKKFHRGIMDKVALSPMFDTTAGAKLNTTEDENLGLGSRSLFGDNMAMNKGDVLKWTVRHELGHAVDAKIKFTEKRARLPEFGGWKQYGKDESMDKEHSRPLAEAFLEKGGFSAEMYNKPYFYAEQVQEEDKEGLKARQEKHEKDVAEFEEYLRLRDEARKNKTEEPGRKFRPVQPTSDMLVTVLKKRPLTLVDIFSDLIKLNLHVEEAVDYVIGRLKPVMHGMTNLKQRTKWLGETVGDEETRGRIIGWSEDERRQWIETNTPNLRKAADAVRISQLNPFLLADGGPVVIKGRIYQRDHYDTWGSYQKAARKNIVSNYQFSAPSEWFAEAYAAYYTPKGDPAREKLNAQTRNFFEKNLGAPQHPGQVPTPERPKLVDKDNQLQELETIEGLDANADRMEEIALKLAEIDKEIEALKKGQKYTANPDAEDGPRAQPKGPPLVAKSALKVGDILIQSGGNPGVAAGQGVATVLRAIFKGATVVGLYHAAKDLSRLKYANYVHAAVHIGGGKVAHATNSGVIHGDATENATFAVFQSTDPTLAKRAVEVAKKWSTDSTTLTKNEKTGEVSGADMGYDASAAAFGGGFGNSSFGPLGKRYAKNLAKKTEKGETVKGMYCSEFAVAVYQVAALQIAKEIEKMEQEGKLGDPKPSMLRLTARSTSPQRLAAKMYTLAKAKNPDWSFKGLYIARANK